MRITTKAEFYKLWESGAFGNKPRTWNSHQELLSSKYGGTVSMRYKGAGGGGFCAYNVPVADIGAKIKEWTDKGANVKSITFNESAPDERLIAQGELMRTPTGLVFRYSTLKGKMRDAMLQATDLHGLKALLYLQQILSPSSYDDIMELLDLYPDSVIEFGAYKMSVGGCLGRNAFIWEVRNY